MNKNIFIISIMARDRVGIVAEVAETIRELGGNLADLSQTVLRGYFTMIVIATFPREISESKIRQALAVISPKDPFEIGITKATTPLLQEPEAYGGDRYVLTAVGPDRIGLVAAVARYLRERSINIVDLTTRVAGNLYTMILMLDLPLNADVQELGADAADTLKRLGIDIHLQHYNIFIATNEV